MKPRTLFRQRLLVKHLKERVVATMRRDGGTLLDVFDERDH